MLLIAKINSSAHCLSVASALQKMNNKQEIAPKQNVTSNRCWKTLLYKIPLETGSALPQPVFEGDHEGGGRVVTGRRGACARYKTPLSPKEMTSPKRCRRGGDDPGRRELSTEPVLNGARAAGASSRVGGLPRGVPGEGRAGSSSARGAGAPRPTNLLLAHRAAKESPSE